MGPKNQPGQGVEYESVLPALFALRLVTNNEVSDFEIETNKNLNQKDDSNSFKFDDILVKIVTKNETLHFAIQTKHAEKDENVSIQPTSFYCGKEKSKNEPKGNFVLGMYCKSSFCDSVIECRDLNCQNVGCDEIHCSKGDSCRMPHRKVVKIDRKPNEQYCILYSNKQFNDNDTKDVKLFTMTKTDNCPGKYYFATSSPRRNCQIYTFGINNATTESDNVKTEDYEMFFDKFSLYVGQMNAKEVEEEIGRLFKDRFQSEECADSYIKYFRHCHDGMYTNRKVTMEMVTIQLIELLLKPEALVLTDNLEDFEKVTKKFEITIVDDDYSKIRGYCGSNRYNTNSADILKEGKDKKIVPKTCSKLDDGSKIKIAQYCHQCPIITTIENWAKFKNVRFPTNLRFIICGKNIEPGQFSENTVFQNLGHLDTIDLSHKLRIYLRQNRVITLNEVTNGSKTIFPHITAADILKMLTGKYYIEETQTLQNQTYVPRQIKSDRLYRESEIFDSFEIGRNYLLCGEAGSGKTELLKKLSKTCPHNYLTVYINFKNYTRSFDVTSSSLNSQTQLKTLFKEQKKIIFFFDALDEAFDKTSAIQCLKDIQDQGFHFWVASRTSIRNELERNLDVVVVEIEELTEDEQDMYIRVKTADSDAIIAKVGRVRSARLENRHLVALPLNLNMLIDIFSNNQTLRDNFEVNDIYHAFIDGNFNHYLKKHQGELPEFPILTFLKYYFWEQYENAAIENCFESRVRLRKSHDSYYKKFVSFIEDNKEDPLGIICKRDDGSLEFLHKNYAEFFVALWISNNLEHVNSHVLKNAIIRDQHLNIRYFLDLELASRKPVFLAVLHKNFDKIEEHKGEILGEDKAGRNVLHLACSYENEVILEELLRNIEEPAKMNVKDNLYKMTPVEYCEHFRLPGLANILRKRHFSLGTTLMYQILDYAIFDNHVTVLEEMLRDCGPLVTEYLANNDTVLFEPVKHNYVHIVSTLQTRVDLECEDSSGRTVLYYTISKNFQRIFVSLISAGAETTTFSNNFTPLQLCVAQGNSKMCAYLVNRCDIDVDAKGNGFSPLHIAVLHHSTSLVRFLVDELRADTSSVCDNEEIFEDCEILGPMWQFVESCEERSVLDLAIDCGHVEAVKFLFDKGAARIKFREFEFDDCLSLASENARLWRSLTVN